jgi:hypothetical protein
MYIEIYKKENNSSIDAFITIGARTESFVLDALYTIDVEKKSVKCSILIKQ